MSAAKVKANLNNKPSQSSNVKSSSIEGPESNRSHSNKSCNAQDEAEGPAEKNTVPKTRVPSKLD